MGYIAYAKTIIGLNVDNDCLYEEISAPSCKHPNKPENKFCSECGKPIVYFKQKPINGYNEGTMKFKGLGVYPLSCASRYSIIGHLVSSTSYDLKAILASMDDLKNIKARICNILEKEAFWDKSAFGLWTILYESY